MADVYSEKRVREIVRGTVRDEIDLAIETHPKLQNMSREFTEMKQEFHKQGVLFEQVNENVKLVLQMLSRNLTVSRHVKNHAKRIGDLEKQGKLLSSTVTLHSQQLKSR